MLKKAVFWEEFEKHFFFVKKGFLVYKKKKR